MKKAQIVPNIIDEFTPRLQLNITWHKAAVELGKSIKPKKMKDEPLVTLVNPHSGSPSAADCDCDKHPQIVVALTDPDAPSRIDPQWGQFCHWIATYSTCSSTNGVQLLSELDPIVEYKPPSPPKKTGPHRYIFVALSAKNGTTDKLNLSKPDGRRHWGYDNYGAGVREWAVENGLEVIGTCRIVSTSNTANTYTSRRCRLHLCAEQEAVRAFVRSERTMMLRANDQWS